MKKVIYLGGFLFLGAMALTSCKKDYTCDCGDGAAFTIAVPLNDYKKADAEDACTESETTYKKVYPNAKCDLNTK